MAVNLPSLPTGRLGRAERRRPRLTEHPTTGSERCRCGTRAKRDQTWWVLEHLPETISSLFVGVVFCSPNCARAHLLESIELLEALPSGAGATDLREVLASLVSTFASLEDAALRSVLAAVDKEP